MIRRDLDIIPTTPSHIRVLAENLRSQDAAEVAAFGYTPQKVLWRCYRASTFTGTALVGGEVAAVWGMEGSPLSAVGAPWLLTAPPIERIPFTFIRGVRDQISIMLTACPRLEGLVDDRYRKAIRMLEILGFTLSEPFPFGPYARSFRKYVRVRD